MLLDASGDEESAIRQLQAGLGAEDVWLKFLAGVELQNLFK
jgi:hypothetical protein